MTRTRLFVATQLKLGVMLLALVLVSCQRTSAPERAPGAEARRVADAFVQHTLEGDCEAAVRYLAPHKDKEFLCDFAEESVEEDRQLAGETRVEGARYTYPLKGKFQGDPEFGPATWRFRATLDVWLAFTSGKWVVRDWSYVVDG